MEFSRRQGAVTVDGARRKGKTAPVKAQVDEVGMPVARRPSSCATPASTARWARATSGTTRRSRQADAGLPGGAARRRAPALHPLLVGLDREAQGHPAHDGRLPDRRRVDPQARLRPQARARRLLVLGRRRLGHRAQLHRLRPAAERRDVGDVRGRARLPAQGHLVGALRALRRDDLLHRADGDPRLHEVGRRARRALRPLDAAPAGDGRASRSTRRPGCGTGRSSAAGAARSSTPGGRPRPATS